MLNQLHHYNCNGILHTKVAAGSCSLQYDIVLFLRYFCKGFSRIRPEELFHFDDRVRVHEVTLKLVEVRCTRDSRRHFFLIVVKKWNQLYQRAVDATSINAFKSKLEGLRYTRMGFYMDQSA